MWRSEPTFFERAFLIFMMEKILFGCGISILFSIFGQIIAWTVVDSIISERRKKVLKVVCIISFIVGIILVVSSNLFLTPKN